MKPLILFLFTITLWAQKPLPSPVVAGGGSGGSGTVTSVATTSPITGGTITTTGTIACATCVTSAASLTSTAIMTGGGSQASQTPAATATLDGSGNISTPGTVSTGVGGAVAGAFDMGQGTAPAVGSNVFGWGAPTAMTTSQRLVSPNAVTSAHSLMVLGAPSSNISSWAYKVVPDCQDSTGNHLNFTQSTDAFSCGTSVPANVTLTIASGTKALDTDAIASTACDTLSTTTATGAASTDVLTITPSADITAVTGYAPVTTGGLQIFYWLTTNTINWKICNPTSSSITPGAVTLNYRITR